MDATAAAQKHSAAHDTNPLHEAGILQRVLSYVGPGQCDIPKLYFDKRDANDEEDEEEEDEKGDEENISLVISHVPQMTSSCHTGRRTIKRASCATDATVAEAAARRGDLEMLKWVREHGCELMTSLIDKQQAVVTCEITAWVKQQPGVRCPGSSSSKG
eukprot:21328-Heterococcus_DN1.PRE.3